MSATLHLYLAAGDALAGLAALAPGCLDAEERARSERFIHLADRQLFDAAHVLLRHALSAHGDCPPAEWRF